MHVLGDARSEEERDGAGNCHGKTSKRGRARRRAVASPRRRCAERASLAAAGRGPSWGRAPCAGPLHFQDFTSRLRPLRCPGGVNATREGLVVVHCSFAHSGMACRREGTGNWKIGLRSGHLLRRRSADVAHGRVAHGRHLKPNDVGIMDRLDCIYGLPMKKKKAHLGIVQTERAWLSWHVMRMKCPQRKRRVGCLSRRVRAGFLAWTGASTLPRGFLPQPVPTSAQSPSQRLLFSIVAALLQRFSSFSAPRSISRWIGGSRVTEAMTTLSPLTSTTAQRQNLDAGG